MGFFPCMGEILLVFPTFMGVFPIPPLSRGRSGGGWGIYVAVVLIPRWFAEHIQKRYPSLPEIRLWQPPEDLSAH